MSRASFGFATPLSSSLRHLTHHPFTLISSKPFHFSSLRAAASAMPDSSGNFHPSLEVAGGAVDKFLPAFKTLHLPYAPYPLIAWNRHVETIFAAFFRSLPDVKFRRECLRARDDGAVALDWVSGDDRNLPSDAPVLILLPGLTGGSDDTYVRHMLLRARSKGWRVVVFNSRGCGDSPVITPQFYSASFLGDISEVVNHVGNRYPRANLYAVGWSLGANILVRYVGQESFSCPLAGVVSLCNPFNLVIADEDFRKGFNIVYDKALANALCKIFRRHALLFEDIGGEFNIPLAANAKSAENDPIAPSRGVPREDIQKNPNCMLIVTPKGGHLGWVAGGEAPFGAPWTDPIVMDFLEHLECPRFVSGSTPDLHQLEV
ncbi:embryogenesis-associated protein emb8 [Phtheirospermum japonicum]|uniref:Embryogenesis-associated protein emb8 n=1 Tax=Phtheirospermum japonicum TaxID=374723 RepID=A0A830BYF4_9LAMI|nr:embryogenesis-associated protein emb8 [Phtheirospermum japonicum]